MILIFGGTTEGRLAVEVCEEAGKPFYYSTKSKLQDVEMHNGVRLTGAMTTEDIIQFCKEHDVRCIVDAAHPFAENLHHTIMQTGLPVIRLMRRFSERRSGVEYCDDYDDAIRKIQNADVRLLLALTGVNTISKLRDYWQCHNTIFRILKREESDCVAEQNGFPKDHIIYYNEECSLPDKEDEMTLMRTVGCDAMITKESGESGGFNAKVEAALELGIKVYVIAAPPVAKDAIVVTGKYGLRRVIEHVVAEFFPLRTGFTTGACATAATKAAVLSLLYDEQPEEVSFALPDGEVMSIPVSIDAKGVASVVKDFSDDPDVTKGCRITAEVRVNDGADVQFLKGDGVGTVTLPGLGIPVGEPAVNPTPRRMIEQEIRALTSLGINVVLSVENGEEIAKKTFNPKVGVVGGISIIGTSGIVSPLSNEAFIQSIRRELEVAKAIGCKEVALVSGKRSEEYLQTQRDIRCIHYGNFIGEALTAAHELGIERVVLAIMLGKAVKLAEGYLDTHSHKVQMNKEFLISVAPEQKDLILGITLARELWDIMPQCFFEKITALCRQHCRKVFPDGQLEVILITP